MLISPVLSLYFFSWWTVSQWSQSPPDGIIFYPVQANSAQLLSLWPTISAFFMSIMSYTFFSHSFAYLLLGLRWHLDNRFTSISSQIPGHGGLISSPSSWCPWRHIWGRDWKVGGPSVGSFVWMHYPGCADQISPLPGVSTILSFHSVLISWQSHSVVLTVL